MNRLHRVALSVLGAALLFALAAYCVHGSYARYLLDDFCTAGTLHDRGFVGAMQEHRATWSGRYAYFVFKGALEEIGPVTAGVTPTLMVLLLAGASWWTLRRLSLPPLAATIAALAIAFAVLDGSPSLLAADGVSFWETGYVTYVLPLVFFIVWAGLFVRGSAIAGTLVMLVAGGLSETSLAAQGALTGAAFLAALVLRRPREARFAAMSVLATLTGLAIVASAPGNLVRHAQLGQPRSFGEGLLRALDWAYGFFGSYVFLGSAALVVAIVVGLAIGPVRHAGTAALVALCAYVASFIPMAWLLPTGAPPAALDVANFFLIAACFCGALAVRRARWIAIAVLVVSIVPLWSGATHLRHLPDARDRAAVLDALDAQLRAERGHDVALRDWRLMEMRVLTEDPSNWSNRCLSRYYGLHAVQMER